jgi:hypothetical protein
MSFFRSSSAAVSSDKNLEQNILLRKTAPPFEAIRRLNLERIASINPLETIIGTNTASLAGAGLVLGAWVQDWVQVKEQ